MEGAWPSGQHVGLAIRGGPGFESRSGDLLDLFSVVPSHACR